MKRDYIRKIVRVPKDANVVEVIKKLPKEQLESCWIFIDNKLIEKEREFVRIKTLEGVYELFKGEYKLTIDNGGKEIRSNYSLIHYVEEVKNPKNILYRIQVPEEKFNVYIKMINS